MSGDFGSQVICMPLPVIFLGMLGKFALPEPEEEKFEDLQADGGSPRCGTFVHGGLSDKFPERSAGKNCELQSRVWTELVDLSVFCHRRSVRRLKLAAACVIKLHFLVFFLCLIN